MIIGEKDLFTAWAILLAMSSDFLAANPAFADDSSRRAEFTDPSRQADPVASRT